MKEKCRSVREQLHKCGKEFALPISVGMEADPAEDNTQLISLGGWHLGRVELSPSEPIARYLCHAANNLPYLLDEAEVLTEKCERLLSLYESHNSGSFRGIQHKDMLELSACTADLRLALDIAGQVKQET